MGIQQQLKKKDSDCSNWRPYFTSISKFNREIKLITMFWMVDWKPIIKVARLRLTEIRLAIAISFVDHVWIRKLSEKLLSAVSPSCGGKLSTSFSVSRKIILNFYGSKRCCRWSDFCSILFLIIGGEEPYSPPHESGPNKIKIAISFLAVEFVIATLC